MANPPWDKRIATDAIVVEQCLKLGGRVLEKPRPSGFHVDDDPQWAFPGKLENGYAYKPERRS